MWLNRIYILNGHLGHTQRRQRIHRNGISTHMTSHSSLCNRAYNNTLSKNRTHIRQSFPFLAMYKWVRCKNLNIFMKAHRDKNWTGLFRGILNWGGGLNICEAQIDIDKH